MPKWYEIAVATTITSLTWMFLRLGEMSNGTAKFFAMVGIALIPTMVFQIRNTTFPLKKKGFLEVGGKSQGFWFFALAMNTFMISTLSIFFYIFFWIALDWLGLEAPRLF